MSLIMSLTGIILSYQQTVEGQIKSQIKSDPGKVAVKTDTVPVDG